MNRPAPWTVRLARTVEKQLDRLPSRDSAAVRAELKELARDPLAHRNAERLTEHGYGWRLRVRSYRVLYDLDPLDRTILVASVERRTSTTYRKRRR
jgi:mRNA-degrading endonuclease RelE of RelBE toxin-antitoxin system